MHPSFGLLGTAHTFIMHASYHAMAAVGAVAPARSWKARQNAAVKHVEPCQRHMRWLGIPVRSPQEGFLTLGRIVKLLILSFCACWPAKTRAEHHQAYHEALHLDP